VPTRYEHAGGEAGLHRLEQAFYDSVLRDPLLQPLFGAGQPQHVDHLTMFTAESFGGPQCFSRELGFARLIDVHRGLRELQCDVRRRAAPAARSPALELGRRRLKSRCRGRSASVVERARSSRETDDTGERDEYRAASASGVGRPIVVTRSR
jgi:Bacterial-like globin